MINREKVIKGLEICYCPPSKCEDCPYHNLPDEQSCNDVLCLDALYLLKEQEAVLAHWDDDTGHWIEGDRNGIDTHARTTGEMIDTFRCSWCGFYQYWKTPFCPNCGAKMEGW